MSNEDFNTLTKVSPALTNDRLTRSLTKWFGEHVAFTHWEHVNKPDKGDSYLSEVIRMRIYGTTQNGPKHVQVYLKYIPKNTARRLTFRSDEFFKNEYNFYNTVLPTLLKFQSSKNLKKPFDDYVKLFLTYSNGLDDVICIEDAGLHDFGSVLRQEGIDYLHCKVIMNALAKFHAISFAMKDQSPEEFEVIKNTINETYYDYRIWDWHRKFWKRTARIAIDAVAKEYPNSVYLEKIKQFVVPEKYEDLIKAVKLSKTKVISHGDCWTSNFLYKYENGRPFKAKLIDFQLARCSTPVLDITFLIYACTDQELRLAYYEDLLKYYHKILSCQIEEMGSNPDIYSFDTFVDEVRQYSFFGLASSLESLPFTMLKTEDAVNMDLEGDEIRNIDDVWQLGPFKTKRGRIRLADNVVHCVDNGYI